MTKKKSTKRGLLASALALLLCVSMLVGSTFAWFTDSVTSAGNIIKSGTLDVTMEWADGTKAVPSDDSADWEDASAGAIFNYDLWEPGYTEVRHIKIANEGSLALKYQLSVSANGEVTDLADVIDVYYVDPAIQVDERTDLTADMKLGTLTQVLGAFNTTAAGKLAAGEKHSVTIALKMQESAGNEYQNKSIGTDFSIQLFATQDTVENDSFNDQYDAGASLPVFVNNATDLVEALKNASAGAVIDATGVVTDMSTIGSRDGIYTVLDVDADTTIKGLTVTFGSNQPITTNDGTSAGEIVFENCTFLSSGFVDSVYFQSGADAESTKLVFNNCTFAAAKVIVADNSGGGVEFNNCKFNLNADGYGLVQCMGGNHTFNSCEFNISGSRSIGSSTITKYGHINLYAYGFNATVTLNQCTNVPSVHKWAMNGTNTFVNNP